MKSFFSFVFLTVFFGICLVPACTKRDNGNPTASVGDVAMAEATENFFMWAAIAFAGLHMGQEAVRPR